MDDLAAYERRFRRAGLPLFIADYTASEDIYTRAIPLLALVFVGECLGAIDLAWTWWQNVLAAFGGLAILLGALGALNHRRGQPALSWPQRIGNAELAGFVLVPAVLPVLFSGQVTSAVVTALANVALIALIYAVVGYGLVFVVLWAAQRLLDQLARALTLLVRAIPLLLVFSLVLFVNTEMWQVFSSVPEPFLALVAAIFVAAGSGFLVARLPREVAALERSVGAGPPLDRRQRLNVAIVMFVSQALQVLVVCLAVGWPSRCSARWPSGPACGSRESATRATCCWRSTCSATACRSPRSCCACPGGSPPSAGCTT